jgi:hypothetical protein
VKATELEIELRGTLSGKAINNPLRMAAAFDHSVFAEVSEVFGNRNLLKTKNGLEMTDAKLAIREEVKNAKTGLIAEAFIYLNQFQSHTLISIYS